MNPYKKTLRLGALAVLGALAQTTNAADGSYRQTIPIRIPPGTNGMQPSLALAYDSSAGNGMLGMGWKLAGLPVISRVHDSSGISYSGSDSYAASHLGLLVRQADGTYRSQVESFTKLAPSAANDCGDGPCYWIAYEPDGRRSYYGFPNGTSTDSRLLTHTGSNVRVWALSKVVDRFGNSYEVSYLNDAAAGQLYPLVITYTKAANISVYRTVEFQYEGRLDVEPGYYQSDLQQTARRMTDIIVKSNLSLVRRYKLAYECGNGAGGSCSGSVTGRSRLIAITEIGSDGLTALPSQVISWQTGKATLQASSSFALPTDVYASTLLSPNGWNTGVQFVDINGDGLTDILQGFTDNGADKSQSWLNTGAGWQTSLAFVPPVAFLSRDGAAPGGWDGGLRLVDLNGDGLPDLLQGFTNGTTVLRRAWLNNGGNCSTRSCAWAPAPAYATPADFSARDSGTPAGWNCGMVLADVDGDGRSDLVQAWSNYGVQQRHVWLNSGSGWTETASLQPPATSGFIAVRDASNPRGGLADLQVRDLDGDGRADLVEGWIDISLGLTRGLRGVSAWLSSGAGWVASPAFAPPIALTGYSPSTGYMDVGVRWMDVNGDGLPDLVQSWQEPGNFVEMTLPDSAGAIGLVWMPPQSHMAVYTNTGRGWHLETYQPPAALVDSAGNDVFTRVVDLNGDGKADLVVGNSGTPLVSYVNSGSGWQASSEFAPPTAFTSGLVVMDLDGDGQVDFAQGYAYTSLNGPRSTRAAWLRTGSGVPDLLSSYANGLGRADSVTYASAARLPGVINRASLNPGIPYPSTRPLLVRVASSDGNGGLVSTRFDYSDDRHFPGSASSTRRLGFSAIKTTSEQTGLSTIVSYYQSLPFQGQVSSTRSYSSTGQCTGSVSRFYEVVYPSSGTELVRPTRELTTPFELGVSGPTSATVFVEYDEFSNLKVRRSEPYGLPAFAVTTTFVNDTVNWILGRVTQEDVSVGSVMLRSTKQGWDHDSPTSISRWIDTSNLWATTSLAYDSNGNLIAVTEPDAGDGLVRRTTFAYDTDTSAPLFRTYRQTTTNALGQSVVRAFGPDGQLVSTRGFNGDTTTTLYDAIWRPKLVSRPDGGTTTYQYLNLGNASQANLAIAQKVVVRNSVDSTDATRALWQTYYFDGTGFVYRSESPSGCSSATTVTPAIVWRTKDSGGRLSGQTDPVCGTSAPVGHSFTYDTTGRRFSDVGPDGRSTRFFYDSSTGLRKRVDASNRASSQFVDALGRITSAVDDSGSTTRYDYNVFGQLLTVTPPAGGPTSMTYNSLGQRTAVTAPQRGTTSYTYDGAGNLTLELVTGGAAIERVDSTYDALNRVTTRSPSRGSEREPILTFSYDEASHANGVGRLTSVTDAAGAVAYSYSPTGLPATTVRTIDGRSYTVHVDYDLAGRPTQVTYPDGSHADYTYRAGGLLGAVSLNGTPVATWNSYMADGRPETVSFAGGAFASTFGYDSGGHISSVSTTAGGTTLRQLAYDWYGNSANGLVLNSVTDGRANKVVNGVNTDESRSYLYDNLYRLTQAVGIWGTPQSFGGATDRTMVYVGNQVMSGTGLANVTYDGSGRMTHKEVDGVAWDYAWTVESELASIRKNGTLTASMTYDVAGQRVRRVSSSSAGVMTTTTYIGNLYEVATYSDGTPSRSTVHVQAHGDIVASWTRTGSIATAFNDSAWRSDLAMGSLYDPRSISGAAGKTAALLNAAVHHPETPRWFEILLFAGGSVTLGTLCAKSLRQSPQPSRWSPAVRVGCAGVVLVVGAGACTPAERAPSAGGVVYSVLPGDGQVAGWAYYHRDPVGSNVLVTDDTGRILTWHSYLPFGEVSPAASTGSDSSPMKFGGKGFDDESGLSYFGARYYDPSIGRFLSPDTIVPRVFDLQSWNGYSFASNNPISRVDPTGHSDTSTATPDATISTEASVVTITAVLWAIPGLEPVAAVLTVAIAGYELYQYAKTVDWKAVGENWDTYVKDPIDRASKWVKDHVDQFFDWLTGGHHGSSAPAPVAGPAPQAASPVSQGLPSAQPSSGLAPATPTAGAPPGAAPGSGAGALASAKALFAGQTYRSGYQCNNMAYLAYKSQGWLIPESINDYQWEGKSVSGMLSSPHLATIAPEDRQDGDLVFFFKGDSTRAFHVAIVDLGAVRSDGQKADMYTTHGYIGDPGQPGPDVIRWWYTGDFHWEYRRYVP